MLLIECPWCGERAQVEFTYGGDASASRPTDPQSVPIEVWLDHVYLLGGSPVAVAKARR